MAYDPYDMGYEISVTLFEMPCKKGSYDMMAQTYGMMAQLFRWVKIIMIFGFIFYTLQQLFTLEWILSKIT